MSTPETEAEAKKEAKEARKEYDKLIYESLEMGNNVIIDNVPFDGLSAIRLVPKVRRKQRFCLNCGKILPLDIPKNFYHECKRPDFVKDKLAL